MGAALEQYLSSFGQSLQQLAQPSQQPGTGRRGTGPVMPPQGAPAFEEGAGAGEASLDPSFEQPPGGRGAPGSPMGGMGQTFETGDPTQLNAAPAPTFEEPGVGQVAPVEGGGPAGGPAAEPGSMEIDDVKSPEDMFAAASPEQISGGADVLEESLKEQGSSLDEAYGQLTGGPPDTRLSREEKAQLLMEFGLGILAQNPMEGEGLAAVGASGLSTMQHAGAMRQEKADAPARERAARLEERKTESEIQRNEMSGKEMGTDADGNLIIIDKADNSSTIVRDAEGAPIPAGVDEDAFEKEVVKDMYMQVECQGLEGDAMQACERRALGFVIGAREIAFPELMQFKNVTAVWDMLNDDDRQSMRYTLRSTGETKRWKDMSDVEQDEVADRYLQQLERSLDRVSTRNAPDAEEQEAPPPIGWNAPGIQLPENIARQIPEGQSIQNPAGGWIENDGGTFKRVNEDGSPWVEE